MTCLLTSLTRIREYLLFTPVTTMPSHAFSTTSTHNKPSHTINPSSKHVSSNMPLHPSSSSSYPFTMSSSSTTLGAFFFNLYRALLNQDTRRLPKNLALRFGLFSWFFFCLMIYGRRH